MGSDVSVWQQMDDAGCKLKVTVTLTCVERVAQVINHKTMGAVQLLTAKWSDFFFFGCARDLIRVQQSSAAHHMTASPGSGWPGPGGMAEFD